MNQITPRTHMQSLTGFPKEAKKLWPPLYHHQITLLNTRVSQHPQSHPTGILEERLC